MSKRHVTLSIDEDVWNSAKLSYTNLSKKVEELLDNELKTKNYYETDLNKQKLETKAQELTRLVGKLRRENEQFQEKIGQLEKESAPLIDDHEAKFAKIFGDKNEG